MSAPTRLAIVNAIDPNGVAAACGCQLIYTNPPTMCRELLRLQESASRARHGAGAGAAHDAFMRHFAEAVDFARAQRAGRS